MFQRLTRLGIDYYDQELPGQVAARVVYDLDQLNEFLQLRGFRMLVHVGEMLVALGVIVAISPRVFPVVLIMILLMAAVTAIQFPIAMRAFGWARDELGRVTAKFEEDLTGRSEIRKLGAEELQLQKFVSASWQRRRARWWSMTVSNGYGSILQFIGTAGAAFVLFRAGNLVLAGTLSIGTALTLRLLSTAATQPLAEVGSEYRDYLDVRVSWRRLQQPFEAPILPVEKADATPCPELAGAISFEGVSFTYPHTGQRVLHDVTFQIEPGTVTSLVGYTGAGKSSIAKLLSRMYDPENGAVLVDGIDLRALDLTTYRQHLGIVPQDAFLFRGTVASNIAYGRPDASLVDIEAAAWAVGAGELLSSLPDGFEHRVDEEGRNLTAAHRQLIALARAWLASPDVLILDEATSCLDARLEEHVIQSLAQAGSTTLLITHREQVAARTDRIVVLEGGRVVEEGTAAEVMAGSGPFHRLWSNDDRVGRKRTRRTKVSTKSTTNGHRRVVKEKA
jgi:ATP-binding cassette subfamily B protein